MRRMTENELQRLNCRLREVQAQARDEGISVQWSEDRRSAFIGTFRLVFRPYTTEDEDIDGDQWRDDRCAQCISNNTGGTRMGSFNEDGSELCDFLPPCNEPYPFGNGPGYFELDETASMPTCRGAFFL